MKISQATADAVDHVFASLATEIARGLIRGAGERDTRERLQASVKRGEMSLWVVHDDREIIAAVVLSVRDYRAKRSVVIEFAAGRDMDSWIGSMEALWRDYRDLVGAESIVAACRLGMAKRLSRRDWREKSIVMELD